MHHKKPAACCTRLQGCCTTCLVLRPFVHLLQTDTSNGLEAARHNLQSTLNALTSALPPMPAGLPQMPVAGLPVLALPVQRSTPTTAARPSG